MASIEPANVIPIRIQQETASALADYARVPISFLVESRLRVSLTKNGLGGIKLVEEKVEPPYLKNYDADEGPVRWANRWNLDHWVVFSAFVGSQRIGGTVVAWKTPEIHMLEDRDDLAVLWDIRIHPDYRRQGIGGLLFGHAEQWARGKGCHVLKVETQNINVAACRFYARQGCELGAIHRFAYSEYPEETMLLWYKRIAADNPNLAKPESTKHGHE